MASVPGTHSSTLDVWQACAFEQFMNGGRTRPALLSCRRQQGETDPELRRRAVVKALGHPEVSTKHLLLEFVGARLAQTFGCVAPEPLLVELGPEFLSASAANYNAVGISLVPGIAFGSSYEEHPIPIFAHAKPKPERLPEAARTYAFDMAIQNVDRRREKPNSFISAQSDQLMVIDFEKAFTFLVPDLGLGPKCWEVSRFGFQRDHVFYSWLKGQPIDWEWVPAALDRAAVAAESMERYLPTAWCEELQRIVEHLWAVRQHDAAFVDELKASLT